MNTAGGVANFDTSAAGIGKTISYTGFTLTQGPIVAGGLATNFALPTTCCAPIVGRTTGNITAATTGGTAGGTTGGTTLPPILPVFYPYTVLAGLNLGVGGITMPPIQLVEATPVEVAPQMSGFVDTPIVVPPEYVPPLRPRKRDRN